MKAKCMFQIHQSQRRRFSDPSKSATPHRIGLLWDLNLPRDKVSLCELRRDRAN